MAGKSPRFRVVGRQGCRAAAGGGEGQALIPGASPPPADNSTGHCRSSPSSPSPSTGSEDRDQGPQEPGQVGGCPGLSPALGLPMVPVCAGGGGATHCASTNRASVQEASEAVFHHFLEGIMCNSKEMVR